MSHVQCISTESGAWPLHDAPAARQIEALAATGLAPHTLMQRAGLAVARLAVALAPHGQRVWVAAGPGNNGGDGFEAALHLHAAGKQVGVTAFGDAARRPADAARSLARAQSAGVRIETSVAPAQSCDIAIDALLGLGSWRAPEGELAAALRCFNSQPGLRLAVDLPSGLDSDHGVTLGDISARAAHTLCLLTLKPGLFTAQGRDAAGTVWFDDLDCGAAALQVSARAWLGGADGANELRTPRLQAQHKGSFGDVIVVGGARTMGGAAVLAGRAALAAGAGRVYVSALDAAAPGLDPLWPELMFRPELWRDNTTLAGATLVCGCGAGEAVREALPTVLTRAARLVLDADALNALSSDTALQGLLRARADRGKPSVLTPHPLEAARLLGLDSAAAVQRDRLGHAEQLAARYACVVLLKGSGTVIAAPGQSTLINASGNVRLATAGTGDVLAGWLGGLWAAAQARSPAPPPQRIAAAAAWLHGAVAEDGSPNQPLTASMLLQALMRAG